MYTWYIFYIMPYSYNARILKAKQTEINLSEGENFDNDAAQIGMINSMKTSEKN